jgi:hypothetical protein
VLKAKKAQKPFISEQVRSGDSRAAQWAESARRS